MFDTVILLSGAVEHALLSAVLHAHNAKLQVYPVFTSADLAAIEPEWLHRARLVAFGTSTAVSPETLDGLGFGAYRFHPGSPQYPDAFAAQFALQDGATQFGVTAHRMTGREAAGPIIDVEWFEIPPGTAQSTLEHMTRGPLLNAFWRLAGPLATQPEPLIQRAMRWGPKRAVPDLATSIPVSPPRYRPSRAPANDRSGRRGELLLRTVASDGKAVEA